MPRAFTEREKKLIRSRLLKQGAKLFAAHGLKRTNVEELAAAAGISKGAFYIFYPSKESLFMDAVEEAEGDYRRDVLAVVELPGPSARSRLLAVLKQAFTIWRDVPILKVLTRSDLDVLFRNMPEEQVEQHFASDEKFILDLVAHCRAAGIPIQASADQIASLFYAIVLMTLHEDDFGPDRFSGTVDLLMELAAAYCLGEVTTETPSNEPAN